MRQTGLAVFVSLFLAAGLPAADQQLVNMVMPDAKIIAGINVDSVRNSPLGTYLLSQTAASGAELQKFVDATGFNPQTDLQEILIATPGAPASAAAADNNGAGLAAGGPMTSPQMRGLLLARGNFNVAKFSTLAQSDGKQNVETYSGATLISDPKSARSSAVAFIGTNLAVAGTLADVKAALDRRTQANTLDSELTTKVNSLSSSQDAWAVSIAPLSSFHPSPATDPTLQGALNGELFKKITETSSGLKLGTQVQLTTELVAADAQNATALGDVVKFLAGMVTMNAGSLNGAPSAVITLLQTLSVQTQGNTVNVTLTAPEDQIEGLINSMKAKANRSGAAI